MSVIKHTGIKVNKESRHTIKDDKWHILNRPAMYVGSITSSDYQEYIIRDNKMDLVTLNYSPALAKIINEIIDNSVDILQRVKKGKIDVIMTNNSIQVTDNGSGIPIEYITDLDGSHVLTPQAMWGKAKAGSNFIGDDIDATTIGTNGVGSFCTNVLSKKFIGITCDGKKIYKGTWLNNCGDYHEDKIEDNKKNGTTVYFEPDLHRFKLSEINKDMFILIKQRLINLSIINPHIEFTFNNEKIKMDRNTFVKMLGNNGNIYEEEKYIIAIYPSTTDDFSSFSILNGLNLKSGSHINYILKQVQDAIIESLPKKYDGIKPGDVKNKLKIIFIGKEFPELEWEGQTKESIKNPDRQIKEYLGDNWKVILKEIIKNKSILDPILFLYNAKMNAEDMKKVKELDKLIKKRNVEKYKPAFKKKVGLFISEGDSAIDSVCSNIGRDFYGFLPTSGVPINALEEKTSTIQESDKFKDLATVLGIEFTKPKDQYEYEEIILAMDADYDGIHIIGLYLAFFYRYLPYYLFNKKIFIFRTPVAMLKDKNEKTVEVFLTQQELNKYLEKPNSKYNYEIKKGLGSLSSVEWDDFFKLKKLQDVLEPVIAKDDKDTESILFSWLGEGIENISFRKQQIINYRKGV